MNLVINSPKSAIAFNIIHYPVHWYGIILVCSICIGLTISFFLLKDRFNLKDADEFIDFSPILIVFSIIGARLFYIIGSFDYYKNNIKEIFMIHHGGMSVYGAIIFGIITLYVYLKKRNYKIGEYFDILAISMPLCQAIGRWGNYFNQEAYGRPTNSFIKLFIDYPYRYEDFKDVYFYHPTFLYESILNLLLFILLITIYFKYKNIKSSTIFYLYLILYGLIRIFVEHFRMDSVLYIDNFPIAQVISLIVILFATINLINMYKKKNASN